MEMAQIKYRQPQFCKTDKPLQVNNCGYYKKLGRQVEVQENELYDDYLIIYNHRGRIGVIFDGDYTDALKGSIIIYPPYSNQHMRYFIHERAEYYWCHASGTLTTQILDKMIAEHGKIINMGVYPDIAMIFNNIYRSMNIDVENNEEITNDLLYTLLTSISFLASNELVEKNEIEDILHAIFYIQKNYANPITIDELCVLSNTSKYNFMRKFKSVTGNSAHQFLVNYRIMQAQYLLTNTSLTVKEISEQVGFSDNLYFSKAFKKNTGMTPTGFKENTLL